MSWVVDHVFCLTSVGAPVADALAAAGLREGSPNTHPGQGTANRRFFFGDGMLELLWVHDLRQARTPIIAVTALAERFERRLRGANPFGICIRPTTPNETPPFATRPYCPPYLPEGMQLRLASCSTNPSHPLVFAVPHRGGEPTPEPLDHPIAWRRLARIALHQPADSDCEALDALKRLGLLDVAPGPPRLDLVLQPAVDARIGPFFDGPFTLRG